MKNTVMLVIPLLLGLMAGTFNFLALQTKVETITLLKATKDIGMGQGFSEENVASMKILGEHAGSLERLAIPASELGKLSGKIANHTIYRGDVILSTDWGENYAVLPGESVLPINLDGITTPPKMRVGDLIELKIPPIRRQESSRWIGPFRLVSVGSEISSTSEVSESRRISIAYSLTTNSEAIKELESFIDRSAVDGSKLVGIKLLRK